MKRESARKHQIVSKNARFAQALSRRIKKLRRGQSRSADSADAILKVLPLTTRSLVKSLTLIYDEDLRKLAKI